MKQLIILFRDISHKTAALSHASQLLVETWTTWKCLLLSSRPPNDVESLATLEELALMRASASSELQHCGGCGGKQLCSGKGKGPCFIIGHTLAKSSLGQQSPSWKLLAGDE